MSRRRKTAVVIGVMLLILLLFCLIWRHRHVQGYGVATTPGALTSTVTPSTTTLTPTLPTQTSTVAPVETRKHQGNNVENSKSPDKGKTGSSVVNVSTPAASTALNAPLIPTTSTTTIEVPAGQEGMHRELIPKNITIERCYYTEEVVNPGTQFYFEINGSGFDASFYRSISVDPDALDVEVKDLKLITANQIQGLMVVGEDATTHYIYPKVIIRGLPVFRAPDPFGVVRHGEVLDIHLTSIDESGQWGKFEVITNLDDAQYQRIKIVPTTSHLDVSNIKPELPFYIKGAIEIAPGLSSGSYGLSVMLGNREIYRKQPMVEVVRPNIGKSGSIESIDAKELAHRPGDAVEFDITGSGFMPNQMAAFSATVDNVQTPPATFTYGTLGKCTMSINLPPTLTKGVYSITVRYKTTVVYRKKAAFAIVPPNWLSNVQLAQPLAPGRSSQLQIKGRDIAPDFLKTLDLEVDEQGLKISPLRMQDNQTLIADIQAAATVTPGDYIIHVFAGDKELHLPRGNIIKVTP